MQAGDLGHQRQADAAAALRLARLGPLSSTRRPTALFSSGPQYTTTRPPSGV
ncbi:Uncharacterised protein [Bordetella pertussis]|nr:Uncharacterised protein [Bordetella pertussis]